MAWLDDRAWCHPKLSALSDTGFRVWLSGICYSSGFGLQGRLERHHQRVIQTTPKVRAELIGLELWDEVDAGAVVIHDWAEHNDKRDARRMAARERKQKQRDRERDMQRDIDVTNGRDGNAVKEVKVVTGEGSDVKQQARTTTDVGVA